MAKEIIKRGSTTRRTTRTECGTCFSYELSDVRKNYVRGGKWVSCPHCGADCRHSPYVGRDDGRWSLSVDRPCHWRDA